MIIPTRATTDGSLSTDSVERSVIPEYSVVFMTGNFNFALSARRLLLANASSNRECVAVGAETSLARCVYFVCKLSQKLNSVKKEMVDTL